MPKVLMVENRSDVVSAVTDRLKSYDLHAVSSASLAGTSLDIASYDAVLCNPSAGDFEFLKKLLAPGALPVCIIIATAAPRGSGGREMIFYRTDMPEPVGLDRLEGLLRGIVGSVDPSAPAASTLRTSLLEMIAEPPDSARAYRTLDVLVNAGRARYAAFALQLSGGLRIVYEASRLADTRPLMPTDITNISPASPVWCKNAGSLKWVAARAGDRAVLLVALDRANRETSEALSACGPRVASFLLTCASDLDNGRRAYLLLEAARSIIHDTRNSLTGLSLCLAAWKNVRKNDNLAPDEPGVFPHTIDSLFALCSEFAGLETAIRFETATSSSCAITSWYANLLSQIGLDVAPSQPCSPFSMSQSVRGLVSRALVQLAWALHMLRAAAVSVTASSDDGLATVAVSFSSPFSVDVVRANTAVLKVFDLVEGRGGDLLVKMVRDRKEISMTFAARPALSMEGVA